MVFLTDLGYLLWNERALIPFWERLSVTRSRKSVMFIYRAQKEERCKFYLALELFENIDKWLSYALCKIFLLKLQILKIGKNPENSRLVLSHYAFFRDVILKKSLVYLTFQLFMMVGVEFDQIDVILNHFYKNPCITLAAFWHFCKKVLSTLNCNNSVIFKDF